MRDTVNRRVFLQGAATGLGALAIRSVVFASPDDPAAVKKSPSQFQIACMTLPYSQYPLSRALSGIQKAGYKFVAWGTSHKEEGETNGIPVMPQSAQPTRAEELAQKCRDLGLEPLMMFSEIYPEDRNADKVLQNRILQAEAAGIPQVLTFGHTSGPNRAIWVERFKKLGPIARDHGVTIVAKQHGETGEVTGEIVREVDDKNVQVNYDAGNVMDYTKGKVNPLEDIKTCAANIRSFCIKDHRLFPVNQDCGPGLGEIDHYRLLHNVAFTGLAMPLCCENISVPAVKAESAEEIDANAKRSREFLELVIKGLQASDRNPAAGG
jgi:sugar phosphate isomerase/epimerase